MICFIMIPFLFRTEYIMKLWLEEVPHYMVSYAQTTIFLSQLYAFFEPIRTAVLATNRITKFMIIPNVFYILTLPLIFLLSIWIGNPVVLIVSVVTFDVIGCLIRIYYALRVSPLLLKDLFTKVIIPIVKVSLGSIMVCIFLASYVEESLFGLIIILVINSLFLCGIIYLLGINREEKLIVNSLIRKYIFR